VSFCCYCICYLKKMNDRIDFCVVCVSAIRLLFVIFLDYVYLLQMFELLKR
jgi:hypothetical protein